jgi:hypothetical protein
MPTSYSFLNTLYSKMNTIALFYPDYLPRNGSLAGKGPYQKRFSDLKQKIKMKK